MEKVQPKHLAACVQGGDCLSEKGGIHGVTERKQQHLLALPPFPHMDHARSQFLSLLTAGSARLLRQTYITDIPSELLVLAARRV